MATGCVKILKKAYEFDHLGKFIPEHKRGKDVDLFRGEATKLTDQGPCLTLNWHRVRSSLRANVLNKQTLECYTEYFFDQKGILNAQS